MAMYDDSRIALFEDKIERIPFSDCEYWVGARNRDGRGTFWDGSKYTSPHRFIWSALHGPIPEGKHVLHTCHQGHNGCVAAHHLKLGTHAENMRDKAENGLLKGSKNANAKLTESDIPHIRQMKKDGLAGNEIARRLGVSDNIVYDVLKGRTWKHV